jgi:mannose-6-phosphate isomerase-like protein (cupin superfamily)
LAYGFGSCFQAGGMVKTDNGFALTICFDTGDTFMNTADSKAVLVRHESDVPSEPSTCGRRYRLISREDADRGVAAWAHTVEIDGAREHYHQRGTELYYVLEGQGAVRLDGVEHPVRPGSMVHIPTGVLHSATGKMRVLVIGIPDIAEDDLFFPDDQSNTKGQ